MGHFFSKPRLIAALVAGGGLLTAATCLLAASPLGVLEKSQPVRAEDKVAHRQENAEALRALVDSTACVLSKAPPSYDVLEVKGTLGFGGFGVVELVQDRQSSATYALKTISKGYIVKCGMQETFTMERKIQQALQSPFVVSFHGSYNLTSRIGFLQEPCLGGELYQTYKKKEFYGSEPHARFYVASLVSALTYLHSRKVIYRDVKPENCVLNDAGYMKICDLKLAKVIASKTYTTCGTPDYFAPELIAARGHGFAVDWWCTGVFLFEALAGHPPFESAYPMQIYSKVMKGIDKVDFTALPRSAKPFIKTLMRQKPEDRLPMQKGGVDNVRRHPWLRGFSWNLLENQTLEPPYVPNVSSSIDTSNFTVNNEDRPRELPYVDDGSGWADIFGSLTQDSRVEV